MAGKHDTIFEILHLLNTFDPIREPEASDIMLISLSTFSAVRVIIAMTRNEQKTIQIVSRKAKIRS